MSNLIISDQYTTNPFKICVVNPGSCLTIERYIQNLAQNASDSTLSKMPDRFVLL